MPPRLTFVYADEFRGAGSTVMRGFQLSEIARRFATRSVAVLPLSATPRRSSLFLTKGALKIATPERLDDLRARGNRLMFDVVDEPPPPTTRTHADTIIASSLTAFDNYAREYPEIPVVLINHHVDPRLDAALTGERPSRFAIGYFGETVNAVLTPRIERTVDVVAIDTSREDAAWLSRVRDYSMHYAVRNTRALDKFKPFLKGFTAAHAGAAILIQRDQEEAVRWLGADYPFLIDGQPDEDAVLAAIEAARGGYGGADWRHALDVMSGIRSRTSPQRIGAELRSLLD